MKVGLGNPWEVLDGEIRELFYRHLAAGPRRVTGHPSLEHDMKVLTLFNTVVGEGGNLHERSDQTHSCLRKWKEGG